MTPRIHYFERVASTMEVIHQLAADGSDAGTIVVAGEQLEGRGSRGRPWHSPPGGLWLSALFRPPTAGGVEVISLRVGLVVAEALEPLLSRPILLKWPNDLMLGERKVGGILCEARWQGGQLSWVAVGVGVNVRNPTPGELMPVATRLAEDRSGITVDEVAEPVAVALRRLDLAAERLSAEELDRFAGRDWLRHREIRSPVSGTVMGLGADGSLMVRAADGSASSLRSGSVELATVSHTR